jgi:hypothetical protein
MGGLAVSRKFENQRGVNSKVNVKPPYGGFPETCIWWRIRIGTMRNF